MKYFGSKEIHEARQHALDGGQALHENPLHTSQTLARHVPACFERSARAAHLFDQDVARLISTARRLGVVRIFVDCRGGKSQHIDLCGKPLQRALLECCELGSTNDPVKP